MLVFMIFIDIFINVTFVNDLLLKTSKVSLTQEECISDRP